VARTTDLAARLRDVGDVAFATAGEIFGDASADELARCANGVWALVTHGLGALMELQAEAGRWEALAALRRLEALSRATVPTEADAALRS
jgi:hypothetical protein